MKPFRFLSRATSVAVTLALCALSNGAAGQESKKCAEISNDVKAAIEKDPSKVLMIVEDALVINEGCAAEIVKSAITASKADADMASQIVQTGVSVAPKLELAITEAATSMVPGMKPKAAAIERPITALENVVSEKNPGKNPGKNTVLDAPEPEAISSVAPVRGVFLLMPPSFGPLPPRTGTNPVSPSNAIP